MIQRSALFFLPFPAFLSRFQLDSSSLSPLPHSQVGASPLDLQPCISISLQSRYILSAVASFSSSSDTISLFFTPPYLGLWRETCLMDKGHQQRGVKSTGLVLFSSERLAEAVLNRFHLTLHGEQKRRMQEKPSVIVCVSVCVGVHACRAGMKEKREGGTEIERKKGGRE